MNKEALARVRDHIAEEPQRLIMNDYLIIGEKIKDPSSGFISMNEFEVNPPCNTAACIAGWTDILINNKRPKDILANEYWTSIRESATTALDLDIRQRNKLFHLQSWPSPYRTDFVNATTAQERADAAVAYINYFMEKDGDV